MLPLAFSKRAGFSGSGRSSSSSSSWKVRLAEARADWRELIIKEASVRGSAVWLTYWKKALTTPTVMAPSSMALPAMMAMTTLARRVSRRMRGLTQLVRKSAFWLAARFRSAEAATWARLSSSWL